MDSDEADEFSIDEVENTRRNIVFQAGKLNEILAEVKTKIPSLDFDDDTYYDNDDITQLKISGDKLSSVCKNRPTTPDDSRLLSAEETLRFLPHNVLSDNTHSEEVYDNLISQTSNFQDPNIENSSNGNNTRDNSIKLDFNKLSNIDFNKVETTLDHFTTNSETSSSAYDVDSCEGKLPEYQDEIILMERLSDLSKDQYSCCSTVEKRDHDVHVLNLDKVKGNPLGHSHRGSVSTKAIHSWTDLGSDQAMSEQPKTIFLDLRPEMPTEDEMTLRKHTTSIQRILGLNNRRSASDSEDDSDNELEDWQELRNKYKEKVFKQKECYEKSAETDQKMAKSAQHTSKRNEKSTQEELCVEELIGGLPSDDENAMRSDFVKTCIRPKSKIQSDEMSSVSATAALLANPKPAENMRKYTNDLGCSLDKEEKEEMVKQPAASRKRQTQHGKKKFAFFQAKEFHSSRIPQSEQELTEFSKKGVGHEKQDVRGTVLSQLSDNDVFIPSDEKIYLPDRPTACRVQGKMVQVEDSRETREAHSQSGTMIATKKNGTSSYSVTGNDEQTSEFKDDKLIDNRHSRTHSSNAGLSKTKGGRERTSGRNQKLENGKEAYEESTAVKETEDDDLETKVTETREPLVRFAGDAKLDKKQAVNRIEKEVASRIKVSWASRCVRNLETFRQNRGSGVDCLVTDAVEKVGGVCLDKTNLGASKALVESSDSDEINVKDVYGKDDSLLSMAEHKNDIIGVREIIVDVERKVKSRNKKVESKTMKKSEVELKLKMENDEETVILKNKQETVKRQKDDELTEYIFLKQDKVKGELIHHVRGKKVSVCNTDVSFVEKKSTPLEERTGLRKEKIEEEIMIGKTSDLMKHANNLSAQADIHVKEISNEEIITEKTLVNTLSNKAEEHPRRDFNENNVVIERQNELKSCVNTNGNIAKRCLKSKVQTSSDAMNKRVDVVLRKAGRFLTHDENEERSIFDHPAMKQYMIDESVAAISKDKHVPETSTETFNISETYDVYSKIIDQLIKEKMMKQSMKRKQFEQMAKEQVRESDGESRTKLKRDVLFSTEGSVSLRKLQNSESRSQLKQRTTKERKKMKERIRKKIESTRSTFSANGKYPAAFNTPIIYDQEASYEQECHSLLPGIDDQLSLLLVVTLLGRGEMNVQRSKGKAFGTLTEINCYLALIAWFLSLGGAYNSDSFVPFSIVGMQQVYQNGKLQLFVGVQPNETLYYATAAGKGMKNKTKAFNKAITKYLSTHSLRNVYQNMGEIYLGGNYPVDETLYNSKMLSSYITVGQDPNAVQRVFESKPGFFWETLEIIDTNEVFQDGSRRDFTAENTIVLVQASLYHRPSCILDLLCRIEDEGCDLAGLRLAYGETSETSDATIFLSHGEHEIVQSREYLGPQHTLALAVRGPSVISKMKSIIGSKLPILDYSRDIPSLRSLYCSTMSEDKLFYCPSYSNQAAVNLARWFGGRVSEKELTDVDACKFKSNSSLSDGVPVQKPPTLLVSATQAVFYLIISPLVPPSFLGHVLHICNVRGFSLRGIRRMHIYKRQGNNFGLSQLQQAAFCPLSRASSPFQSPNESPPESPARGKVTFNFESALVSSRLGKAYPSTLVVVQKENGIYHSTTLVKQLTESLTVWKKINLNDLPHFEGNPWRLYFCIMPFNESNSKSFWGDVCHSPDTTMLHRARRHGFWSNSEDEQVCVLCAVTEEAVQYIGLLLKILYSESNPVAGNWELLAIKSFVNLSLIQAREVTPIEVGEQSWENSVKRLMSSVVFACVLRGVNIIQRLREFMASLTKITSNKDVGIPPDLEWWLSQTSEVAFRQITVLFEEKELFPDEKNRANMKYVPPLREKVSHNSKSIPAKVVFHKRQRRRTKKSVECKNNVTDDSSTSVETIQYRELPVIQSLLAGPRPITTVALIKPSCLFNTKNLGKIFKSICQDNFGIVALRMGVLTGQEAEVLVHSDNVDVNEKNVKYITSGASLLMCLKRENAVKKLLDILGPDDPVIARSLDPFLLRGCYGVDAIHNSMHGSETYSAAQCEMRMLFPCGLCCDSTVDLEAEQIPCRAYDETIGKNFERKLTKHSMQPTAIEQSLVGSLVQINCLVLTHHIVYGRFGRKRIALVDVLECFLSSNFTPVGMKMALLSEEQIDNCLNMISSKSEEKQKLRNKLTEGPCIVIALQRDNAITCFDAIIESAQTKCRSLGEYQKHIIRGNTEKEARNLLLYFFDGLVPNCAEQICAV